MPVVLCNGMNRSGSTLQYNLTRLLVERSGSGRGEGYFALQQLATHSERLAAWAQDNRFHVLKAHELPPDVWQMASTGTLRACTIIRDLREVAASFKRIWGTSGDKLLEELDRAVAHDRTLASLDAPVLRQRYEVVTEDLEVAASEIARFLDLSISQGLAKQVALDCSAANMRKLAERQARRVRLARTMLRPLRKGLRRLNMSAIWHRIKPVPASGKTGMNAITLIHVDHLRRTGTANTVLKPSEWATITQRYEDWLQQNGYPI